MPPISTHESPNGSFPSASAATDAESQSARLVHADRVHHWHGFTQMADYESLVIERAEGNWLIDSASRRLLDGVSSLWCNVHGHHRPEIDRAIIEQLGRVAHVTSIGMGCDTTACLAERLAGLTPGDLDHVFFSSDGSSAVEAAIKMAIQYWHSVARQSGRPELATKTRYLAFGSAYHGDTTGAVSLGDITHFHRLFRPILFEPLRGPCPDSYRLPAGVEPADLLEHHAQQYESLISRHAGELAAVVLEPLIQAAAGMILHPPGLLARIRQACDRHEVLLIADEVATGFGRTGRLFACQHEGVVPDILCLGKGLTGGYLPMAATVARRHLFDAFLSPRADNRQFFHGHTFGGNPLAAAAALASIELFETDRVWECLPGKIQRLAAGLRPLGDVPIVGDVRQLGMMVGIELVADKSTREPFPSEWEIGNRVCELAMQDGVWIRPLGDVVVLMPPLSITLKELDLLTRSVRTAIDRVAASLAPGA
ncbi:MAG: adenosylmethionine--8-amino-7-oxononanoate transaminase [Planctomycetaceae bacterium]|nr:MAG: adenosylmethionine--8-amino-7-oxononanoate transaminase [Planctomycetaceae bacterium]